MIIKFCWVYYKLSEKRILGYISNWSTDSVVPTKGLDSPRKNGTLRRSTND